MHTHSILCRFYPILSLRPAFVICSIIASLLLLAFRPESLAEEKPVPRVVLLAFDGFSAQAWKELEHPNLDALFREGVLSVQTRSMLQSATMFNWTSHLTGSGPEFHGVTSNDWTFEEHDLPPLVTDEDGYYPSIFSLLKDKVPGVKTGFFFNWKPLNRPYNPTCLDLVSFEEKDEFRENYAKAVRFLKENATHPTLLFLYTVHIDHAGHRYGWMSDPYIEAVRSADVGVGQFVEQLKKEGLYEGTHFMVISDHGGLEKKHGGYSVEEMTVPWGIVGPGVLTNQNFSSPNRNSNTAVVVARLFGLGAEELPEVWTGRVPRGIFSAPETGK